MYTLSFLVWNFVFVFCLPTCGHLCKCACLCMSHSVCGRVCLVSVSAQLSQWVVTVKLFHLVGLLLQSVLWEQPSARHLSEEHYTFWCFNPFFPLLPSFSHPQPLNLISHFFSSLPFLLALSAFSWRGWNSVAAAAVVLKALMLQLCLMSSIPRCYCYVFLWKKLSARVRKVLFKSEKKSSRKKSL